MMFDASADFSVIPGNYSVAEYCRAMDRRELIVNHDYQRSDKIWPISAKSFLIETIILGYPMPQVTLHQKNDLETRRYTKEIVDGQQRSDAIFEFYRGVLRLSSDVDTTELRGRSYAELPEELKRRFLDYRINADTFTNADDFQIREMFRRMNSYTVPLNPEETRHAVYQGPFKWFVQRFGSQYGAAFKQSGLFTAKQLIRMGDAKLLAEVIHAFYNGIQTTNQDKLNHLYKKYNGEFPDERGLGDRLRSAFDTLLGLSDLWNTSAFKPFMAYSLVLAIMHVLRPVEKLQAVFELHDHKAIEPLAASASISSLIDEFDNKDDKEMPRLFPDFVEASEKGTNVKGKREVRFKYFCSALIGTLDDAEQTAL
jgi:hypothetical protein